MSTGVVKSVLLLLGNARILSVSELGGDSVNSAVPGMVKSLMVNSQCSVHLVSLFTKNCDILKQKKPGGGV